ncbi:MAG: hypothetical protein ACRDQZ_09140 [Mycobacteriales bacterium]
MRPSLAPEHVEKIRKRFWAKVRLLEGNNACWLWLGATDCKGYGHVHIRAIGMIPAHCLAFFLEYGRWPQPCGLHTCDNHPCVRPDHVFEGTKKDNTADMIAKRRAGWQNGFKPFVGCPPPPHGEQHFSAKLTENNVREIIEERIRGVGQRVLAKRFGVRKQTIQAIDKGKTWRHVR